MREVGEVSQADRFSLLGGLPGDVAPDPLGGLGVMPHPGWTIDVPARYRRAPVSAGGINDLALRDREQPARSGVRVAQLTVVRQRRQQRFLEGVLAAGAPQSRYAETQQRAPVRSMSTSNGAGAWRARGRGFSVVGGIHA